MRECHADVCDSLKRIEEKVILIHTSIYGDGNPERGFIVRMDRLEQFRTVMLWMVSAIGVSTIGIIVHGIASAMTR